MSADPRSRAQRRRDTEHRLTHDIDLWVATASPDGAPYLVPLSFDWDGEALLVATPTDSPTGRNLAATRTVRLGLGHTRDVSMIDGEVEVFEIDAIGLDRLDRAVLTALCRTFGGGPVGLGTLAVAVAEERETVEEVAEPFLVRAGLLARTPRGRVRPGAR